MPVQFAAFAENWAALLGVGVNPGLPGVNILNPSGPAHPLHLWRCRSTPSPTLAFSPGRKSIGRKPTPHPRTALSDCIKTTIPP